MQRHLNCILDGKALWSLGCGSKVNSTESSLMSFSSIHSIGFCLESDSGRFGIPQSTTLNCPLLERGKSPRNKRLEVGPQVTAWVSEPNIRKLAYWYARWDHQSHSWMKFLPRKESWHGWEAPTRQNTAQDRIVLWSKLYWEGCQGEWKQGGLIGLGWSYVPNTGKAEWIFTRFLSWSNGTSHWGSQSGELKSAVYVKVGTDSDIVRGTPGWFMASWYSKS